MRVEHRGIGSGCVDTCAVVFLELYRQWPGYFCDSFNATQAGDLRRAGHRVGIYKAYLHEDLAETYEACLHALATDGPWDLLIVDRVWSQDLLHRAWKAAGEPQVVVNQWESPSSWPEVGWRISPMSRQATVGLAALVGGDDSQPDVPNVFRRTSDGQWLPPSSSRPFDAFTEFGPPLDLAYDVGHVFGLSTSEAGATRYLVMNMGCPYRGASNESGFLDGLDLPTSWGAGGCTFCNVGPYERQTPKQRQLLMRTQLEALAERGPYDRLVVQDEYIFRDLDVLVDLLVELGPPVVELMVRARVDYLESCSDQLIRALETLGDRGTIVPYLIGLENFSDQELRRYNKGQTAEEVENGIARLDAIGEAYPNFHVSPSQGFILFGPWTTLEDLELNVAAFRRVGFQRFRGRVTRSKLRLNPDAALIARARADGLVQDSHDRPDEDNAADTGYQAEIPYRFAEPATARVWELLNGPDAIQGDHEIDRLERATRRVRDELGAAD